MIEALVEGVRSVVQACHLVILAPLAMLIVAARGRWYATAGAVVGVVVGGWVFATRWVVLSDTELRISALAVITAFAALALVVLVRDERRSAIEILRQWLDAPTAVFAVAALVGLLVTQWWRPCVGVELGEILTQAPGDPLGVLLPTVGFMLGVASPLILLGLVYASWQPQPKIGRRVGLVGAGVGIVLAGSVVVGQHGEIVARLFEWSQ